MTTRWLWAVGVLLGAQLLTPPAEHRHRAPHARELKRLTILRPRQG